MNPRRKLVALTVAAILLLVGAASLGDALNVTGGNGGPRSTSNELVGRGAIEGPATVRRSGPAYRAIVALGHKLQRQGFHVSEHPAFGGVCSGCHAPGSFHYIGLALDVNHDQGGEVAALSRLAQVLKAAGWHVLWQVAGHFDHLHVDTQGKF